MPIDRVDLLRASTTLTGIDFVHVAVAGPAGVYFLQHDVLPYGRVAAALVNAASIGHRKPA